MNAASPEDHKTCDCTRPGCDCSLPQVTFSTFILSLASSALVQLGGQAGEGFVRAQASIYVEVVGGVIAVFGGFENRAKIERVDTEFLDVTEPLADLCQSWNG